MRTVKTLQLIGVVLLYVIFQRLMTTLLTRMGGWSSLWQSTAHLTRPTTMSATIAFVLAPLVLSSPFSARSRYYLRLVAYFVGLSVGSITGVLAGLIVPIVQPSWRRNIQWLVARTFYGLLRPVIGWQFVIEGEEWLEPCYHGKSHIIVGNHQSMIDILYLGRLFPKTCVVMAKKELKFVPGLGQFMSLSRAVFIDRKNRVDALQALETAGDDMKRHGLSLFIFPEGTRSNSLKPGLLPFKKGAFHLAIRSKLCIIPVVCENYSKIYHFDSKRFESGKVIIKVLEPVVAHESESAENFSNRIREKMLEALIELSSRPGTISYGQIK